ncbi:RNase H domain [Carpediemonas membranifera]|uniref:RNase H domain n=1 Tax=Carpediemonas membranifera TaxID=201153 RepID=A0A8J6BCV6_9EUKA|nr:RNase H domain [Carpediemonas membranifera]|eukprot:KAG9394812.1 RNase H domain [Carpediemonas membranifera]
MDALLEFADHLQDHRALGGRDNITDLVEPSIAELAGLHTNDSEEEQDYIPLLVSTSRRKKQRIAAQDDRVLKRLGSALRPSRPSMRLQLFRMQARTFEPDEVARINRRFKLLLRLFQPDDPDDVLKEAYCRAFKFQSNNRIMYRLKEAAERKDLKEAMADTLIMARDLHESKDMLASFACCLEGVYGWQYTPTEQRGSVKNVRFRTSYSGTM